LISSERGSVVTDSATTPWMLIPPHYPQPRLDWTKLSRPARQNSDSKETAMHHPQGIKRKTDLVIVRKSTGEVPASCSSRHDSEHLFEILSNIEDRLKAKAIHVKCQNVNQASIISFFRKL